MNAWSRGRMEKQWKVERPPQSERAFGQNSNLTEHQRTFTEDEPHKPSECKRSYGHKLTVHERILIGEKLFACTHCDKGYRLPGHLEIHQRTHAGERPKCRLCEKSFADSASLKKHGWVHTCKRPYQCVDCGHHFNDRMSKRHKMLHTGEKPYRCSDCGQRFVYLLQLLNHERMPPRDKPYQCSACNQSFSQLQSLISHRKIHMRKQKLKQMPLGEITCQCAICQQDFSQPKYLGDHMRIHTREQYKYQEGPPCGAQLRVPETTHAIVKRASPACNKATVAKCASVRAEGEETFGCSKCGQGFSQPGSLIEHWRTHKKEQSYQCVDCGRRLSNATSFKRHRRIHTGERP